MKCQCGAELELCPSDWKYSPDYWVCTNCGILDYYTDDHLAMVMLAWESASHSVFLNYRETCNHWINFAIYEAISPLLKEQYINQFETPKLTIRPAGENKWHVEIWCKANHKDAPNKCNVECSRCYRKSLIHIKKQISKGIA